jgi:hypothetical protein
MSRKKYTPEQIIQKLGEAEIRLGQGEARDQVCRGLAISERTFYRWRKEFGGLRLSQAHRLKGLELRKRTAETFGRRSVACQPTAQRSSWKRHLGVGFATNIHSGSLCGLRLHDPSLRLSLRRNDNAGRRVGPFHKSSWRCVLNWPWTPDKDGESR